MFKLFLFGGKEITPLFYPDFIPTVVRRPIIACKFRAAILSVVLSCNPITYTNDENQYRPEQSSNFIVLNITRLRIGPYITCTTYSES